MDFENLSSYLGRVTDKECPECSSMIIEDSKGTQWCSECIWSNDERLTDIIKVMKQDEHDRQVSDGEENH